MQEVPVRKIGDKVRIMDTPTARESGLQNMTGTVTQELKEKDGFGNNQYVIFFEKKRFNVVSGALLAGA